MKRTYDVMNTGSKYNIEKPTYKEWFALGNIFFGKGEMAAALKYYKQAEDYYREEDSSDVYMLARIKSGGCKTKAAIYEENSYMQPEELTDLSVNGDIIIKVDHV